MPCRPHWWQSGPRNQRLDSTTLANCHAANLEGGAGFDVGDIECLLGIVSSMPGRPSVDADNILEMTVGEIVSALVPWYADPENQKRLTMIDWAHLGAEHKKADFEAQKAWVTANEPEELESFLHVHHARSGTMILSRAVSDA